MHEFTSHLELFDMQGHKTLKEHNYSDTIFLVKKTLIMYSMRKLNVIFR